MLSYICHVKVITHGPVYTTACSHFRLSDSTGSHDFCGFFKNHAVTSVDLILKLLFHLHYRKKSARNITYDEFKTALAELARKKYKDKTGEEAEAEVFKLIEGKAPVIAGVTVRRKA